MVIEIGPNDSKVGWMDREDPDKQEKARRYIDTPDEAPDDATVHEGERGGIYYETDDTVSPSQGDTSSGSVTDFAQTMAVSDWPERHMQLSEEDIRHKTEDIWTRANPEVAQHVLSRFTGFRDKSPQSAYVFSEEEIVMRPDTDEETVAHEFGHATLGTYGFNVNDMGNMLAHFYANEVPDVEFGRPVPEVAEELVAARLSDPHIPDDNKEKTKENLAEVKERYAGIELQREDMHVFIPDDWEGEEPPEQVQRLVEAVNTAWDRQIDAKKDPEHNAREYIIGKPYSATNAHETMAMTHETMQGGVADPVAVENLYKNQQELLDAYTDIFTPAAIQQDMLNELYKSFGPNSVWEEMPYPDAEGVLQS